jgi:hypothetical protein
MYEMTKRNILFAIPAPACPTRGGALILSAGGIWWAHRQPGIAEKL